MLSLGILKFAEISNFSDIMELRIFIFHYQLLCYCVLEIIMDYERKLNSFFIYIVLSDSFMALIALIVLVDLLDLVVLDSSRFRTIFILVWLET